MVKCGANRHGGILSLTPRENLHCCPEPLATARLLARAAHLREWLCPNPLRSHSFSCAVRMAPLVKDPISSHKPGPGLSLRERSIGFKIRARRSASGLKRFREPPAPLTGPTKIQAKLILGANKRKICQPCDHAGDAWLQILASHFDHVPTYALPHIESGSRQEPRTNAVLRARARTPRRAFGRRPQRRTWLC